MRRLPIAVVLVWAVCTVPALAAFPGENGRIAYEDGVDIRTINPDGSDDRQLTTDPASDFNPEWSPDGQRILFTSSRDGLGFQVYVMNADGTGQTRLTDPPDRSVDPAWSPDGQRIVFVRNDDLWLMNADGSGQAPLLSRPFTDSEPDWSPDGTRIAFHNGDIWTIRPDGTGLSRVTTITPPLAVTPPYEFGPEWSPDGKQIAYAAGYIDIEDEEPHYIAIVRLDGTGSTFPVPESTYYSSPAWSPDGSRIAASDGANLFTVNTTGGDQTALPPYAIRVDWQPLPVGTRAPYMRPRSAARFRVGLVPAAEPCTTPNREHGPPLASGSCSPVQRASYLTVGIGGGDPALARSVGFMRMKVLAGAPGPPDDSDVRIRLALTNVMRAEDRSEYTGELRGELTVRRTDRELGLVSSTSMDFPFGFTVLCAPTPESTLDASSCITTTSVNAVLPEAIKETRRTIWALDQLRVYDGGPDEDADTDGNSLFMTQGMFVP